MLEEENELFFQQVKGKKIRLSTWPEPCYFISEIRHQDMIQGHVFNHPFREGVIVQTCFIDNGFNTNQGPYWILVNPNIPIKLKVKIKCTSQQ